MKNLKLCRPRRSGGHSVPLLDARQRGDPPAQASRRALPERLRVAGEVQGEPSRLQVQLRPESARQSAREHAPDDRLHVVCGLGASHGHGRVGDGLARLPNRLRFWLYQQPEEEWSRQVFRKRLLVDARWTLGLVRVYGSEDALRHVSLSLRR
ncbi:uncharacterized protein PV07_10148 [Cladophialophora immunda]|uniref:Uncharacterized protein n=1 Tax=Cladophialophora immunda TaxID=569365 RepID=A0A0D2CLJ9_9EURO|nr:uncharacterized protein PV07_10148 [Cladophialophora immunda]KIW24434.1 hypothetical protein PV07_10148 [Cladophialophora immunda]